MIIKIGKFIKKIITKIKVYLSLRKCLLMIILEIKIKRLKLRNKVKIKERCLETMQINEQTRFGAFGFF